MATPLYKKMRSKGTTFYSFPNAIKDFSLANFQDNIKISPSKFILLNIPRSVPGDTSNPGVLDFRKSDNPELNGLKLYSWDPNENPYNNNSKYSDILVEGLRNYVANCDTVYRESRINTKKDFYNPAENKTPTEMIFWKWCKKMNILDLEPAVHKIDWDKNLTDFQNPNASSFTNRDYFRKYLWKEREIKEYNCIITSYSPTEIQIDINEISKFKINDKIEINGDIPSGLTSGTTYIVNNVTGSTEQTTLIVTVNVSITGGPYENCTVKLNYHKLVQYIGEVQAISKIKTSENNFTEFTAMIPPHAGQTPTILFETVTNTNYYPGLELPILPEEIQQEINGAEYLSSPIRTNPGDFPGSYFGYFDTIDKTYANSTGDSVRLRGDYFGIELTNNDELVFNSDNIDGLAIDFNRKHYLKMNLPGSTVRNFDEFNSMVINDNPPSDFEYNAILWYYDIDDGSGVIDTNLFGIEFLNNPDDDFGLNSDKLITPTRKLVTNSEQDGLSYIYNLNLDFKVDNSTVELKYDPTSVYNLFGFDLYNNVMANYGKLNRNFMNIINEFVRMNKKLLDLESILYSQTDLNEIKDKLNNFEELLKLYQTNQFVNSDTIGIEIDYTKNYPALKFNAKNVEYDEIYNLYTDDIINYNIKNSYTGTTFFTYSSSLEQNVGEVTRGSSYSINVPDQGKTLVNIYSNIVNDYDIKTSSIVLSKDLIYKQSMDIIVRADICTKLNSLQINILFDDGLGKGKQETLLVNALDLPIDVQIYNPIDPTGSTFNNSHYYDLETYIDSCTTGNTTRIDIEEDTNFDNEDWVYISGFLFVDSSGKIIDYSGLYKIIDKTGIQIELEWDTDGMDIELSGKPKIFYYRGFKINILRVDESQTSELRYRYKITKEFLNSENIQKLNG